MKGQLPRESVPGAKQRIVTLRVPAEMHTRLIQARTRGQSINQICVELIDKGLASNNPPEPATAETLTCERQA